MRPTLRPLAPLFLLHGVTLLGAWLLLRWLELPAGLDLAVLLLLGLWPWLVLRGARAAAPADTPQEAQAFRSLSQALSKHTVQNALAAACSAFTVARRAARWRPRRGRLAAIALGAAARGSTGRRSAAQARRARGAAEAMRQGSVSGQAEPEQTIARMRRLSAQRQA